jgi:hypothetical protein
MLPIDGIGLCTQGAQACDGRGQRFARSWRKAEISNGATTILFLDPVRPEARSTTIKIHHLTAAGPRIGVVMFQARALIGGTTYAIFSRARQRFTMVHQSIGSVAPQGSIRRTHAPAPLPHWLSIEHWLPENNQS